MAELLSWAGVRWCTRPRSSASDKGGKPGNTEVGGDLGVNLTAAKHGAKLRHVLRGGAAWAAGLSAKDVVMAFDGLRVTGTDLHKRARAKKPGETVTVHAFRRDELLVTEVTLQEAPHDTVWLELDPEASDEAVARRTRWLAGG